MVSIQVRPPEVDDRVMPDHWEGDLIKGAANRSAVGVLVERTTRLVLLAKMDDATAESALEAFSAKLGAIAAPLRETLTYDQGHEMASHRALTESTGGKVCFCDPHSPWQRGTCEGTFRLLRQYLPKGTDLSTHSQAGSPRQRRRDEQPAPRHSRLALSAARPRRDTGRSRATLHFNGRMTPAGVALHSRDRHRRSKA